MIYGQIKNGVIQNTIVLEDANLSSLFAIGFDFCIRIDNLTPIPGINWNYNGTTFSTPTPPISNLTQQQIVENKIAKAIDGFTELMIEYAAQNVLLGITQAGKTELISDTLLPVMQYGESGSLYAAISALQAVQLTDDMAPFLTAAVITDLINKATSVLTSL